MKLGIYSEFFRVNETENAHRQEHLGHIACHIVEMPCECPRLRVAIGFVQPPKVVWNLVADVWRLDSRHLPGTERKLTFRAWADVCAHTCAQARNLSDQILADLA